MSGQDHYYARVEDGFVFCACGYAEPISDATFDAACGRLNAHIRNAHTAEEWQERMRASKLGLLDATTGDLQLSPKGPKS